MYSCLLCQERYWLENCHFRYTPSFGWWRTSHTYSGRGFEDKGEKIEEQNNQRLLGAVEGSTKWICHMGRGKYFAASKSEIAWGQAILGGKDCNFPILNNCIVGKFHQSY